MNLKKILALLMALTMVLCLCACGESANEDQNGNETTTEAADETTKGSDETTKDNGLDANGGFAERPEDEPTNPAATTYTVKVEDTEGNPVFGAVVTICGEMCSPATTGEDGIATCITTQVKEYVEFVKMPEGYTYADEEVQKWYFEGETELTIVLQAVAADETIDETVGE